MKTIKKVLFSFCVTALCLLAVFALSPEVDAASSDNEKWICAWGTAPTQIKLNGISDISAFVGDVTVRTVITPTADGKKLRLKISNYYGEEPLKINYVTVAKSLGESKIDIETLKYVTFDEGYPGVTIPAGREYYSDAISFDVNAHENIAVTIYVSEYQDVSTMGLSGADTYITTGDAGRTEDFDLLKTVIDDKEMLDILAGVLEGFGMGSSVNLKLAYSFVKVVPCLASLDVLSDDSGYSVVVVGDSTVANEFPLYLAQAIFEDENITNVGVAGKGVIGNSLLRSGLGMGAYLFGESMISRFQRDVLTQSGVKYVIVKIGANDIMHPVCTDNMENYPGITQPTAQELIAGYRKIFDTCHEAGIKVIAVGITQWKGTTRDYFGNGGTYIRTPAEFEKDWQIAKDVNAWLASTTEHDGYVDFCAISANPLDPDAFLPEYSEDAIHPTAALQKVWANFFPLSLIGVGKMPGGVVVNEQDAVTYVGEPFKLTATVYPESAENKQVEWYSENPEIASVDENGTVTPYANGTAVIGCRTAVGGYSASCRVTVKTRAESIFLNYNNHTIYTTRSFKISATVMPDFASDKSVVWSSSNENVAVVTKNGEVTGVGAGTAIITCKTADGKVSSQCTVNVRKKVQVQNITLSYGSNTNLESKALYKGKSFVAVAQVSPSNATFKDIKWSSSDSTVAAVDSQGRVTAIKAGKAVIKCTSVDNPMVFAACTVTVKVKATGIVMSQATMKVYETKSKTLTATVLPSDATNKNVTWKSNDKTIAKVNSSGNVTGVKPGTTYIVATSADGSFVARCKVTVVDLINTTKVTLSKTSLSIKDGSTATLKATVSPSNATYKTVSWSSSNKKVATVDANGKIKAVAPGTVYITAKTKDTGKTAKCKVTVKAVVPTSVKFTKTSVTVNYGEIVKIKNLAVVSPSNATDKTLKWTSSNPSIVKVSQAGNVKGLKAGKSAVITVTTNSGKKTAQITVKVAHVKPTSVKLNKTSVTLSKGGTVTLTPSFAPSNTTVKTVTWSTSDKSVVTVNSKGVVKAVTNGTAVITCKTSNGKTASCKVTVKVIPVKGVYIEESGGLIMYKGSTYTLKAVVVPSNASNKNVTWVSSDTSIATVNSKGKVTAKKAGACEIKVTTAGGEWTDVCTIIVR